MRKEFTMTQEQCDKLLDACKPVPYMVIGGIPPRSPQENANAAWASLGQELGFEPMSVRPVAGKGMEVFTADVVVDDTHKTVDGLPVDYTRLPVKYRDGIENYIEHAIRPGSFLCAVLANDFQMAVQRADSETTLEVLRELILWLHNFSPSDCHGSSENFNSWLKGKQNG